MTGPGAATGGEPNTSADSTRRIYSRGDVIAVCEILDLDPRRVASLWIEPHHIEVGTLEPSTGIVTTHDLPVQR